MQHYSDILLHRFDGKDFRTLAFASFSFTAGKTHLYSSWNYEEKKQQNNAILHLKLLDTIGTPCVTCHA